VDEYQDTNQAQYQIVNFLSRRHGNLCVVGDDDQSIYRWRGADLNNILDFERDHPGCRVIKLEQNYRSTQNILDAAGGVVANNAGRKGKTLWTENPTGEAVVVYQASDEQVEAGFIVERIRELVTEQGQLPRRLRRLLSDQRPVARPGRRAASRRHPLRHRRWAQVLRAQGSQGPPGVPPAGSQPRRRPELQAHRERPGRGIGAASVEKLEGLAQSERVSIWEACTRIASRKILGPKILKALEGLVALIEKVRAKLDVLALPELIMELLEATGYLADLKNEGTIEAESRMENLQELVSRRPGVHGPERGPEPASLPGQRGAHRRHRYAGRGKGDGDPDDVPLGQGAGVPGGLS